MILISDLTRPLKKRCQSRLTLIWRLRGRQKFASKFMRVVSQIHFLAIVGRRSLAGCQTRATLCLDTGITCPLPILETAMHDQSFSCLQSLWLLFLLPARENSFTSLSLQQGSGLHRSLPVGDGIVLYLDWDMDYLYLSKLFKLYT